MITAAKTDYGLSFIRNQARQYAAKAKNPDSAAETVLDSIRQTDPARADALKKQLDEARQVAGELQSGKGRVAQAVKAAAAAKVQAIKEQIKLLRMMGGSPQMIARQIARLTKELAAAAREYAGAAGSSTAPDEAAAADTAAGEGTETAAGSDSTAGGATEAMAEPENVLAAPAAAGPEGENGDIAPEASGNARTAAAEESRQYQAALRQKLLTDWQNQAAGIAQETSAAEADRQFAREVRALAAHLKLLARQQEQRLEQAGDHSADREIARIKKDLAAVEKSVAGLGRPNMTATA